MHHVRTAHAYNVQTTIDTLQSSLYVVSQCILILQLMTDERNAPPSPLIIHDVTKSTETRLAELVSL